jgi:6-phosphogluconolactonase
LIRFGNIMHRRHLLLLMGASLAMASTSATSRSFALTMRTGEQPGGAGDLMVYLGTYTSGTSKGIYVSRMNRATGALSAPALAGEATNPSYLAVHPTRDFLYAVNEIDTFDGKPTGSVSAFAIDRATGTLKLLNRQASGGSGPAHLITDRAGRNVLVANYGGGSVSVLPVDADGRLRPASAVVQHTGSSVNPERQKAPHAHAIQLDQTDRFAYVPDLGIDKVMIYRFDTERGSLVANGQPSVALDPGAGPRHFAVHPGGRYAYVISELHSTITVFTRNSSSGALTSLQTISTRAAGQSVQPGYSTADVQVHPSGRFLYGSNRGHDSIAVYAIDETSGLLTFVEAESTQGRTPRAFGIDPSGTFLLAANQRSDSVVVFRIDQKTGQLTPTGARIEVGAPVCVKFFAAR